VAKTSGWALAVLLLACLGVFLGCLAASWDKPLVGDMVPYLWWARTIVETGVPLIVFNPDEPPYPGNMHPPLYPYLIALSFQLFGDGVRSSIYVNLVAFLATLALTAALGHRLGLPGAGVAVLVALLLIHPFAIQSTLLTDTDTSILPLAMLAYVLLLLALVGRLTSARVVLLGGMFGVCLWTKFATPLILPFVTALYVTLRAGRGGAPSRLGAGARAGAVILVVGVGFFVATHALFALGTGLSPWEPMAWPATKARADLSGNLGRLFADVAATLKTDVLWFTPPFALLVLMALALRLRRLARARQGHPVDLVWLLALGIYLTYTVIIPTDGRPRYKTVTLILFALAAAVTLGEELERRRWDWWARIGAAAGLLALLVYYAWLPEPIGTAALLSTTGDTAAKVRVALAHALPLGLAALGLTAVRWRREVVVATLLLVFAATAVATDIKQARAASPHNLFGFGLDGFEETVAYVQASTHRGEIIFSFSDLPYYTGNGFYNYSTIANGRRVIDVERLRRLAARRGVRLFAFEIHPLRFGPELFATPEVQAFLREDFCLQRRFGNHYVYGSRQAGLCPGPVPTVAEPGHHDELIAQQAGQAPRDAGIGRVGEGDPGLVPAGGQQLVEGRRRRGEAHHLQAGAVEHRPERALGEEAKMGAVEDAAVDVVEAAQHEQQPDPEMRDVGHRDDDDAVGRQQLVQPLQHPGRVTEVLQHVRIDDGVEARRQRRELAVEIGHQHALAVLRADAGGIAVALDGGHAPALIGQLAAQQPFRGANVQQPPAGAVGQPAEDHRVAAVRVRLEDVARALVLREHRAHGSTARYAARVSAATRVASWTASG
jgi:hypothetical protein